MEFLKQVWHNWLKIARPIGNFQSQVILSIFYLVILFPLGIFFKIKDPLDLKISGKRSNFSPWNHPQEKIEQARKQY